MTETHHQAGDVGEMAEDAQRHDRIFGDLPLNEEKDGDGHQTKDDQTQHRCGVPGVGHAAKLEAEQQHEGAADDGERTKPVDGG